MILILVILVIGLYKNDYLNNCPVTSKCILIKSIHLPKVNFEQSHD